MANNDSIDDICNKVCGEITPGWRMEIHLENGAGWVELIDNDGCVREGDMVDMTIQEQIEHCLFASKELPILTKNQNKHGGK